MIHHNLKIFKLIGTGFVFFIFLMYFFSLTPIVKAQSCGSVGGCCDCRTKCGCIGADCCDIPTNVCTAGCPAPTSPTNPPTPTKAAGGTPIPPGPTAPACAGVDCSPLCCKGVGTSYACDSCGAGTISCENTYDKANCVARSECRWEYIETKCLADLGCNFNSHLAGDCWGFCADINHAVTNANGNPGCDDRNECGWHDPQTHPQGHCVNVNAPNATIAPTSPPAATSTPTPTPYIVVRVRDVNGNNVRVNRICKVICIPGQSNCSMATPQYCDGSGFAANFNFPKNPSSNRVGGRITLSDANGNPLMVTSADDIDSPGRGVLRNGCFNLGGACYDWGSNSWNTGSRRVKFVVATLTPTLYPTAVITGTLNKYDHTIIPVSCQAYPISGPNPAINLTASSPSGITTSCTATLATQSYRCTINYNNQAFTITQPQSFTMSATSTALGYGTGGWSATNSCGAPITTARSLNAGTSYSYPIYFPITPTAAPSADPWYKLKDASFNKIGGLDSPVPKTSTINPFDGTTDDNGLRYLITTGGTNDPGIIVGNPINNPNPLTDQIYFSSKGWFNASYTPASNFNVDKFLTYIKSRKEYVNRGSSLPATIDTNKITLITSSVNLFSGNINVVPNAAPAVLLVQGNITISNNFNTTLPHKSVILMATGDIIFASTVTEANAIFIAGSNIDFGGGTNPLKISGNISSTQQAINLRARVDSTRPSEFIIFNPQMFVDTLSLISTSTYEWKQLQ